MLKRVVLPAPLGPMTPDDLTLVDHHVDRLDGLDSAEPLGDALDLEQAHRLELRHAGHILSDAVERATSSVIDGSPST